MIARFFLIRPRTRLFVEVVLLVVLASFAYAGLFGPPGETLEREEFLVTPEESLEDVSRALAARGLIGNRFGFSIAYTLVAGTVEVRPGGYELAPGMDAWTTAKTLSKTPRLAFVRIPHGYRKEQIAILLERTLGWTNAETERWLSVDTTNPPEGEYYPDTYLIPADQPTADIATRLRARFALVTKELRSQAQQEGRDWNEVLTIASLIEREAAGPHDMGLISGVIHNRLEIDMPLGIDATLQYIRGEPGLWWPTPKSEDKYLESPYNTYFRPGLPPYPIANPSIEAIDAALNPEPTACYYYLHDYRGNIHCARTYSAHIENINRYLR